MASTYSTNLALELIGTGDQSGTWGTTTNTNLGTLLEQAISGYVTQAITDGADTTITIPNGATGVARNMALELTGALTAARNLIVPANKKLYFIYNNTTGGFAVTVKVSGLTGVSVPNGAKVILVCNGTDIVAATNYQTSLTLGSALPAASGGTGITSLGTGVATALGTNVGSAGAFVTFNGAGGTPSSMTATNLSGTAANLTAGTASAVASSGLTASALASSAVEIGSMTNGTIVHSRTGNAETIAIKTFAGTDPSASDPVIVLFRNTTVGTGDYAVIKLTAATSITISSGSTLGFTSAVAGRLWIVGFNDAGTFRLGVINCVATAANPGTGRDVTGITALGAWGIASSTAEGGAGAADSAQTFYTGTAVTSKAYAVLGYSSWESGLTTAGTWVTAPTRIQLFDPSVSLPGTPVQVAFNYTGATASGSTIIPADDTIPQNTEGDQYMTQAITPSSACNALNVEAVVMLQNGNGGLNTAVLFQDSTANGFAALTQPGAAAAAITVNRLLLSQTTSSTTFKARAGNNGATAVQFNGVSGTGRLYGGIYSSRMTVTEIMG